MSQTLAAPAHSEIIIKKSRFIGCVQPMADRASAQATVDALWKQHPGAAHICWALLAGGQSAAVDDGEPGGTAGRPMLDVLRHQDLEGVLATVVRYFGGVKLGAGGLVRAYTDAVAQLDYAKTLGYSGIDATMLRADIAMRKNKSKEARTYVQEALAQQKASGQPIPAAWYDRAISMAYQANDWDEVSSLYRERLEVYPSTPEWRSALTNYLAGQESDPQVQLDLYRLQAANGAMASERDYQTYAQLAEKTGNFAEAKAIIEAGRSAGKLTTSQATTAQLLKAVTPKATKDIAAMPALAKKAAAASDGKAALNAADGYFSLGQYPQAVEQYRLALSKGGVDQGHANARLGIALARSGDLAGGKTALAQVTSGNWSNVAGFWSVWVDLQHRKSAQQGTAQTAS